MPAGSAARRETPDAEPERLPAAGEPHSPPGGPERPVIASFAALRALVREDYAANQRRILGRPASRRSSPIGWGSGATAWRTGSCGGRRGSSTASSA